MARAAIGSKPTIHEEPDEDAELNRTRNPTETDEILLAYMEEVRKPNEVEINAKTSNAIEFHLKHDEKKENLPLKQLVPEKHFMTISMSSTKIKLTDSLDHNHGITRSN